MSEPRATGFSDDAVQYAEDVVAGRVIACRWVRLACERFLADLDASDSGKLSYRFDRERGDRAGAFMSRLPHVKGEWAKRGELICLEPWQSFVVTNVFGWVDDDGLRRFRTAYEEIARKNAKTTKVAGAGLYAFAADGEEGAEVYSAATTRDQAKIAWRIAKQMARKDSDFREQFGVSVQAHTLSVDKTFSKFEPLSAEANTLDGLNVHCAVIDELHAHKSREVWDVLETGTGSRAQPLLWGITTAGDNRHGICYELRTYATKILEGVIEDDTFFGIIYTIDKDDDWTDPACWPKANPNLGVSVYESDMARLARKAEETASARNAFMMKRLNVWVSATVAWLNVKQWGACPRVSGDMAGRECYGGLDLSSKIDLTAFVLVFPADGGYYDVKTWFWCPESTITERSRADRVPYQQWASEGHLTPTPGHVVDYGFVVAKLEELSSTYDIRQIGFDPWNATATALTLQEQGARMVEVRQGTKTLSEPSKEVERLIIDGKLRHDHNKLMRWMVSNVAIRTDPNGNIRPDKKRSSERIDGVVALSTAMARAMFHDRSPRKSPYEDRDLLVL